MRVDCAKCGHHDDEICEFGMPRQKAQPMEAYEPGKCPEGKAPEYRELGMINGNL